MRTLFAEVTTLYPIAKFTADDYNDYEKSRAVVRTFIDEANLNAEQMKHILAILELVNANADAEGKQKFLIETEKYLANFFPQRSDYK